MTSLIERIEALSFDAKCAAGAWFGMMGLKSDLTFQLQELRPSDRALAALTELVVAELVSVEPFNRYGGLVYRPLVDFRSAAKWLQRNIDNSDIRWPLTEPIKGGEKEAKDVKAAALRARGVE